MSRNRHRTERPPKRDYISNRHNESERSHDFHQKSESSFPTNKRHRHDDSRNENRYDRSQKGDFSRYSGFHKRPKYSSQIKEYDDKDGHKPELKSREQVLKEQKTDLKEFQKNRRMFGFVAGLLEKFDESNNNKHNSDMRLEIEAKIEQRQESERKAEMEKRAKKAEEKQIRENLKKLLSEKKDKILQFETWEKSQKNFDNCILTRTKQQIYYSPREHNKKSRERLEETKSLNRIKIAEERVKHQKSIDELDAKIHEYNLACGLYNTSDVDENTNNNSSLTKRNNIDKNRIDKKGKKIRSEKIEKDDLTGYDKTNNVSVLKRDLNSQKSSNVKDSRNGSEKAHKKDIFFTDHQEKPQEFEDGEISENDLDYSL